MKCDFSAAKLLCSSTVLQRSCVQSVLRSVINCSYRTQGDSLSDGVKSCDGSCPYVGRSQADGGQVELSQTHPATVKCVEALSCSGGNDRLKYLMESCTDRPSMLALIQLSLLRAQVTVSEDVKAVKTAAPNKV